MFRALLNTPKYGFCRNAKTLPFSSSFATLSRRLIHIKTVSTPNENSLKFISTDGDTFLNNNASVEIKNSDQELIKHSSLARTIFVQCPGVESIMIGKDFITINKDTQLHWRQLTNDVIDILTNHLAKGNESVDEEKYHHTVKEQEGYEINVPKFELNEEQQEVSDMIDELIQTRIRPAVQDDGGDILYRGFDPEKGIVYLKLQGACKSCSSSEDTLKTGIEGMLKHYIEEVEEVVQILDPEEEIALREFEKLESKLSEKN
ncbi:nifu-like protein [Hanseniaspora osmophila]|uniref:NifU-like protein, mitochondrial n=1 Tax=Hanseniaspora osmophila TaxID=56408 RepID=A0A1E5RGV4_9ASCO|nr:NifU-like protein, mitochondrial [Hanseniaspora osmophila]